MLVRGLSGGWLLVHVSWIFGFHCVLGVFVFIGCFESVVFVFFELVF